MKKTALVVLSWMHSTSAFAIDCGKVAPFEVTGTTRANVSIARFFWGQRGERDEEVCDGNVSLPMYDIRGREEEAYHCLKPASDEVVQCRSRFDDSDVSVIVAPAAWVRRSNESYAGDFHFHAYVIDDANGEWLSDLFGRTLLMETSTPAHAFTEAAIRHGRGVGMDGLFVRVQFLPEEPAAIGRRRESGSPIAAKPARPGRKKKDETTESSAYRCVTGFNCRQFMRRLREGNAAWPRPEGAM